MNSQATLACEQHRPSSFAPCHLILGEDEKNESFSVRPAFLIMLTLTVSHTLDSLPRKCTFLLPKGPNRTSQLAKQLDHHGGREGFLGGCERGGAVERAPRQWTGERGGSSAPPHLPVWAFLSLSVKLRQDTGLRFAPKCVQQHTRPANALSRKNFF